MIIRLGLEMLLHPFDCCGDGRKMKRMVQGRARESDRRVGWEADDLIAALSEPAQSQRNRERKGRRGGERLISSIHSNQLNDQSICASVPSIQSAFIAQVLSRIFSIRSNDNPLTSLSVCLSQPRQHPGLVSTDYPRVSAQQWPQHKCNAWSQLVVVCAGTR